MKLSEAILKGCEFSSQCGISLIVPERRAACALGAAGIGMFGFEKVEETRAFYDKLHAAFPILKIQIHKTPCHGVGCADDPETSRPLQAHITHLNDSHRWTREAIAMWVESIEKETVGDEPQKQEAEEVQGGVQDVQAAQSRPAVEGEVSRQASGRA